MLLKKGLFVAIDTAAKKAKRNALKRRMIKTDQPQSFREFVELEPLFQIGRHN